MGGPRSQPRIPVWAVALAVAGAAHGALFFALGRLESKRAREFQRVTIVVAPTQTAQPGERVEGSSESKENTLERSARTSIDETRNPEAPSPRDSAARARASTRGSGAAGAERREAGTPESEPSRVSREAPRAAPPESARGPSESISGGGIVGTSEGSSGGTSAGASGGGPEGAAAGPASPPPRDPSRTSNEGPVALPAAEVSRLCPRLALERRLRGQGFFPRRYLWTLEGRGRTFVPRELAPVGEPMPYVDAALGAVLASGCDLSEAALARVAPRRFANGTPATLTLQLEITEEAPLGRAGG